MAKKTMKKSVKTPAKPAKKQKKAAQKSFADLLGIKEGHQVVCLHCKDQFISKLRNQLPTFSRLFNVVADDKSPDMVIRFFNEHADFDASFRWLAKRLAPGGCVWGVIPNKAALKKGQKHLEEAMAAAAVRSGFVQGKTMPFSPLEQGIKFCLKKE